MECRSVPLPLDDHPDALLEQLLGIAFVDHIDGLASVGDPESHQFGFDDDAAGFDLAPESAAAVIHFGLDQVGRRDEVHKAR